MANNDLVGEFIERLRARIAKSTRRQGECLIWTGARSNNGYGVISVFGRPIGVHRVVAQLAFGTTPEGHDVHHACGEKLCVNLAHLGPMSRLEHNWQTFREGVEMCQRGHYFSEENTYWAPNGTRHCKACRKLRDAPMRKGRPTHCPSGHAYDEENTYVFMDSKGRKHRLCRTCRRETNRARSRARAKRRGGPGYRPASQASSEAEPHPLLPPWLGTKNGALLRGAPFRCRIESERRVESSLHSDTGLATGPVSL